MITGANGFSGNYLLKNFKVNNYNFIGISKNKKKNLKLFSIKKCDLTKSFDFPKVDWVIHTASHHLITDFRKYPKKKFRNNILMTKNLIKYCKINGIKNFIFFSTIDISYDNFPTQKKLYIRSKLDCEKQLTLAYNKRILKSLIILRLPAIIGKNCNLNFVGQIAKQIKRNENIKLWGAEQLFNNFIHIGDLLRLIKYSIKRSPKRMIKIINCLPTKPIKLINIVKIIKKKFKSSSKVLIIEKKTNLKKIQGKSYDKRFNFLSTKKNLMKFIDQL